MGHELARDGCLSTVYLGSPALKCCNHLLHHFIKEDVSQLRVKEGTKLEGDSKVHSAGPRVAREAGAETPHCLQVVEQPSLRTRCLDQVGAYNGDEGGVALHHRWEAHSEFGLAESSSLEHYIRLLAPGDKEAVVFHACYHVIHLLHGIPNDASLRVLLPLGEGISEVEEATCRQHGAMPGRGCSQQGRHTGHQDPT